MRTNVSRAGMLLVALVIGSLVALPAAAQSKASAKSVESLNSVLKAIEKGKGEVQAAMDSLKALTSGGDANLTKNYNTFTKNVQKLNKTRESAVARAEDMKSRREAYLAEWQKKSAEVSNPEIQAHMQQRADAVKATFEGLQPAGEALREAFPPFLSDMNDIQKMLSVDLSASGMTAAKPIADKAVANGNIILQSLDTYLTTLTKIRDEVSPKAGKK